MRYTKPQITSTHSASVAIMGGKSSIPVNDNSLLHQTTAAYSADE
jgi:hypothetical protein